MSKLIKARHIEAVTPFDRILKAWLANNLDSLSQTDKNILERIEEVDKRFRKGYSMKVKAHSIVTGEEYTDTIKRPYRMKELAEWNAKKFDISLRQAYEDVKMSQKFFLFNEGREDKDFARGHMIQWGETLLAKAEHYQDLRAAALLYKELRLIRGLDKFEDDVWDPTKFEPIDPKIVMEASAVGFEVMDNPTALVAELKKSFKQSVLDKILDDSEDVEEIEEDGGE